MRFEKEAKSPQELVDLLQKRGLAIKSPDKVVKFFETVAYSVSLVMPILSYVRNICAHHSRIWNRNITIRPSKSGNHKNLFADTRGFSVTKATIENAIGRVNDELSAATGGKASLAEEQEKGAYCLLEEGRLKVLVG